MEPAQSWTEHPFFIVGLQKSGTTLLISLLDGCEEAVVIPEETQLFHRDFVHPLRALLRAGYDGKIRSERVPAEVAALIMEKTPLARLKLKVPEETLDGFVDYRSLDGSVFQKRLEAHLAIHETITLRTTLLAIARALLDTLPLYEDRSPPACWFEKTPTNLARVDAILSAFPSARFIQIIRDPRDNWLSLARKWPDASIVTVTRRWLRATRAARNNEARLGKDRYLVVRYEDLVENTDSVMADVFAFTGLTPTSKLRPTKGGQPWYGNSMFNLSAHGIYKGAVGRYKDSSHYGENKDIERIIGTKNLTRWGYESATNLDAIERLSGYFLRVQFRVGDWWRVRKLQHTVSSWRYYPRIMAGEPGLNYKDRSFRNRDDRESSHNTLEHRLAGQARQTQLSADRPNKESGKQRS